MSFWARSSVAGVSISLMSGWWLGHDSNYTGTALANATLSDAWQQVHAVTTVQDPSSSCLQVQASGARAMVFLDDFFVGTNSTAS